MLLQLEDCRPAHYRYSLLPLHSMVPAAEQRRVFVRPPAGMRKIVLATNIGAAGLMRLVPFECLRGTQLTCARVSMMGNWGVQPC